MNTIKLPWIQSFDNGYEVHQKAITLIGTYRFFFIYAERDHRELHDTYKKGDCAASYNEFDLDVAECRSVEDIKAVAEADYYNRTHEFAADILEFPREWVKSVLLPEALETAARITIEVPDSIKWNVGFGGSGNSL